MKHSVSKSHYTALDTIKEGIIILNTKFNITYINTATSTIFNKPKCKLLGRNGIRLLSAYNGSLMKHIGGQLVSNPLPFTQEITIPLKDRIFNTTFTKIVKDNKYTGSLIVFQDITEEITRFTQSTMLKESQGQVKTRHSVTHTLTSPEMFSVHLSHEINTSLTIILGYVSLSLNKLSPRDPLKNDLKIIQEEALRISSITRKLLTFTDPDKLANDIVLTTST